MEKTRFKGAVFATASALLYGLGAALIKLATKESMSVATLLVGRGGCGMLLLLLAGCIRRKPPAVKLRSLPKIALYGVFGTVATQIFLNLAYLYLPVGTVTTIHFMYPALVAVMEAVLFRQKLPDRHHHLAVLTISMGLLFENVTAGAERGLLFCCAVRPYVDVPAAVHGALGHSGGGKTGRRSPSISACSWPLWA